MGFNSAFKGLNNEHLFRSTVVLSEKEENTAYDNNNFGQYGGHRLFTSYIYIYIYIYNIYFQSKQMKMSAATMIIQTPMLLVTTVAGTTI